MPATVFWAHNTDGRWDEPTNWSTGQLPTAADDVIIDRPGVNLTVDIPFIFETPRTIQSAETLRLIGGKLSGTVTMTEGASVVVRSGLFDALTLNGSVIVGESDVSFATVNIANGLTLNGSMTARSFDGGNTSSVNFLGSAQTVSGTGSITMRGGSILGNGTVPSIFVRAAEGAVTIAESVTVRADGVSINTGFTSLFTPRTMITDGPNGVTFDGLSTAGGTVSLRAESGGYIGFHPYAKILNTGGRLKLDGPGQIELRNLIDGGTVQTVGNTVGVIGTNDDPVPISLIGVTLEGEFLGQTSTLVENGLTLNGIYHHPSGFLRFHSSGEQKLQGTGTLILGTESQYVELSNSNSSSHPITLGAGISIRAQNAILSGNATAPLIVEGPVTTLPGGQVSWNGKWQIRNSIDANLTQMTFFGEGQLRGPIRMSQSAVNFEAKIDNTGNTLVLDGSGSSFLFQRFGTLKGGTLAGINGAKAAFRQTTLDGVTIALPVTIEEVEIVNGLTVNSTMDLTTTGKNEAIQNIGSQAIVGNGMIRGGSFLVNSGTTLTVGPSLQVQNVFFFGLENSNVVMQGHMIDGGAGLNYWPLRFQNQGTVEARSEFGVGFNPAPLNLSPNGTLTGGKWIVGKNSFIRFPDGIKTNAADITLGEGGWIGRPTWVINESYFLYDLNENRGRLSLASPMKVSGGFSQTATGELNLVIRGEPSSQQFGRIVATGPIISDGQLSINVQGFVPAAGQSYDLLSGTTAAGQFDHVTFPAEGFAVEYRANAVKLNVNQTPADLSVTNVSVPAVIDAGQQVTVRYDVRNSGADVTTGRRDEIYLSADDRLDASDILLTRVERPTGLASGSTDIVNSTISMPGVAEGNYRIIVLADARRTVPDTDRGNNVKASDGSVVGVPLLTVGVPRDSGFSGVNQDRYFRIQGVPGKSLRLSVQSKAASGEFDLNSLVGRLPASNDPGVGQPIRSGPQGEIRLPFTTDDMYFVVVSSRNGAVTTSNFTITASIDVLAVDAVTPVLVGTGGAVTFTIYGTELGHDSIVRVLGPNGSARTANRVELTGDRLFARVDLTGMPQGAYAVEVKRGTAIAKQDDSFLAVDNMPGQLKLQMTIPFFTRGNDDLFLEFTNTGGTDISGTLIEIAAKNAAFQNNTATGFGPPNGRFAIIPTTSQGPVGVIPPGASGRFRVPFEFSGGFGDNQIEFEAHGYDLTNQTFNYDRLHDFPFPGYSRDQWVSALQSVETKLGSTWGSVMDRITDSITTRNLPLSIGPPNTPAALGAIAQKARDIIKAARDATAAIIKQTADRLKSDVQKQLDDIQKKAATLKQQISEFAERIQRAGNTGQTAYDEANLAKLCQALAELFDNGIRRYPGASDVFGIDNPPPNQPVLSADAKALPLDPRPTTSGGAQDPPLIRRIGDQAIYGQDVAVALRQLGSYNPDASRTFIVTNGQGGVIDNDRYEGAARALKQKFPDANVFMADWSEGARYGNPEQAAKNIPSSAKAIAAMIRQKGIDPGKITYVSESFGGYVNDMTADILASGPGGKKADMIIAMNPANQNPLAANKVTKEYLERKAKTGFFKSANKSVSTHTDSFADHNRPMGDTSLRLMTPPGSDGIDKHVYGLDHFAATILTGKNKLIDRNLDVPDGDRSKAEMDGILTMDGTIIDTQKPTLLVTDFAGLPCDPSRLFPDSKVPADKISPIFGKIAVVRSYDPNEKVGIAGDTPDGFVRDPQLLPYRINFENTPDKATAPAQEVFITDVLDADLDPASFEFGDVGFGSTVVSIPGGRQLFAVSVEAKNQNGSPLRVDIDGAFERSTRTIRWTFRSVDPATGTLPTGVFDGLLPVNDATGRGEGFVRYSVRARSDLTTGTKLENSANIIFDANPPIVTNTVRFSVDRDAPVATVNDLPATSPPGITVTWGGSDEGSGIATYTVFVSTDGGPLTPWLTNTTKTNGTFNGEVGRQYGFAAIATDRVGNGQAPVATPQSTTTVSATTPLLVGYPEFAIGSGNGNHVRLTDVDGTTWQSFSPFANGVRGVRTATADFDGDGFADLVVGTGPGVPTRVDVYEGFFGDLLFSLAPFEATFTGGIYVAAGDITGDGKADLVITPDEGGGPRARVFSGNDFTQIADFFGIDDPNFRGGARAAIGDLNGDGKGDLLVAAGFGGGPRVAAYDGARLDSNGGPKLFGDFFAFEQSLRNGTFIAAGDVNGDGFADLVAGGGPGGGPRVYILDGQTLVSSGNINPIGNFFAGDINSRGGIRVSVKDLDGDAKADLVVGAGTGAGNRVTAYRGSQISLAGGTPTELFAFDAGVGALDGVFVG